MKKIVALTVAVALACVVIGCNGRKQTVTHGGDQCFTETEETTCPLYATGVLKSCKSNGAGGWNCTHYVK